MSTYAKAKADLERAMRAAGRLEREAIASNWVRPVAIILMSGLDDEHAALEDHGWHVLDWRGHERIWLSPHCRASDYGPLFGKTAA